MSYHAATALRPDLGCLGTRQSPPGPGSDAEPQWDYHLDCGKGNRVRSIQLRSAEAKGEEEEHEEKAMAAQTRCTADILLRTTSGIPLGGDLPVRFIL
jgi:hypothetical protein